MLMLWLWIVFLLMTIWLADRKKRSIVGFFFLALLTGPLAIVLLFFLPSGRGEIAASDAGVSSLEDARRQIRNLRASLSALEAKIVKLEEFIEKLSPAEPEQETSLPEVQSAPQVDALASSPIKTDPELDFARNWLNKIGIAALALGVAFLVTYSFTYVGALAKILFGYAVAGGLFFFGFYLANKDQFRNYAKVLLAGAWGLVYFTTYAMHHFEASRIIASRELDFFLLALVVSGIGVHVLRYKSQVLMSLVLCVAYLTLGIGEVSGFTVVSLLLLAGLVLYFVYRFCWIEILFLGIVLTYTAHYLWLMPGLHPAFGSPDLVSLIFLSCYWLLFLAGTHLVRGKGEEQTRRLAGANLCNVGLYALLAYPLVTRLFYTQRYILAGLAGLAYLVCAVIMKKTGRERLYQADLVCGVFGLTVAAALKFTPVTGMLVWIVEVPFLLLIARMQNQRLYLMMGYVLAVAVAARLLFFETPSSFNFLGFWWPWYGFVSLWAGLAAGVSFCLTRNLKTERMDGELDRLFNHFFSFAFCWHFVFALWPLVRQPWVTLSLSLQGLVFLALGLGLGLKRFRVYSAALLALAGTWFVLDPVYVPDPFLRSCIVTANLLPFFVFYYTIRRAARLNSLVLFSRHESGFAFFAGLFFLVAAIHQYLPRQWGSLGLGVASVAFLLAGFFSGSRGERVGGMCLLALTLSRVVFVDLAGLELVFKIITLMALGVLFLGVSYVYTRFDCASGRRLP